MSHSTSIQFETIKPHRGDQRWAFEELCFLLFADEFRVRGEAVRREGAGGDGGLEGYIHDGAGRVVLGLQAKYFVGKPFDAQWWPKMSDSVETALKANAHHAAMERYVICTPRTFTESQRKRWDGLCGKWKAMAKKLGYKTPPGFEHWDFAKLEGLLLQPKMRGHLLYWFGYPHFDLGRCQDLNRATTLGLHERFRPDLHTPTECEAELHRFLRTQRFWEEFCEFTSRLVGPVLDGSWPNKSDFPESMTGAVETFRSKREALRTLLGDGCRFPVSFRNVRDAGRELTEGAYSLEETYEEHLDCQRRSGNDAALGRQRKSSFEQRREDLGDTPNVGGWAHWFDDLRLLPDAQCLLVLGPPGGGKSHTMAKAVQGYQESGGAVLFVEGRRFTSANDPWTQFLRWADFPGGVRDFLDCFSALAESAPARAGGAALSGLICIDALNETPHREVWLNHLEGFAAELKNHPNLKLLVSCRTDFADLTVSQAIREEKADAWRVIEQPGLGAAVFEAAQRYLAAYKVRGAEVLAMAEEMENPLFLKVFCEAFEDSEVPPGARSLPSILTKYIDRKAQKIGARIGCSDSVVKDALRDLGPKTVLGQGALPAANVRSMLALHHTALDETKSLYRALVSEGFLHELRSADALGETITVRFAFERVWDYLQTLYLLPTDRSAGTKSIDPLRARIADADWCQANRNLLSLLAIRLPEEGHGELHDVGGLVPLANVAADQAFTSSIRWRTRSSFTPRTEQLWQAVSMGGQLSPLAQLSMATLSEHPWNADDLHARLEGIALGERDRGWTTELNRSFAVDRDAGVPGRLVTLAEGAANHSTTDSQARLFGIALAWVCSTTAVAYRHRAQRALGRIVRTRPALAVELVLKFQTVNDPQIVECVLYAAAVSATYSASGAPGLGELARVVHTAIFSGDTVPAHILFRHYGQVVCEQVYSKGVLLADITPASFRPPFRSEWPKIMSESDEVALSTKGDCDPKACPALSRVLHSTRTEHMGGGYGDWGRYEMGTEVAKFLPSRLGASAGNESRRDSFDDLIARRYVLGRVLELGLDPAAKDTSDYNGRDRPLIERLGKKYQWVALHEFLGFLTDHYQYRSETIERVVTFRSAKEFSLPDLLDPVLPEPTADTGNNEWAFTQALPWWMPLLSPFPRVLGGPERRSAVAAIAARDPEGLLRPNGLQGSKLALSGVWMWTEPTPCWIGKNHHGYVRASMQWLARSYAVPKGSLQVFIERMNKPMIGNSYLEELPNWREDLSCLISYPDKSFDLEENCAETRSKVEGVWFAVAGYSTRVEGNDALSGTIPSPQLARLASLEWTQAGLNFGTKGAAEPEFRRLKHGEHSVTLMDAALLGRLFAGVGLQLVWRLYGWKWSWGSLGDLGPQRDYWALYVLGEDGLPQCVGGGTWNTPPSTDVEHLPWPSQSLR